MSLTAKKLLVNIAILILVLASGVLMIVLKEMQKDTTENPVSNTTSVVTTK